MTQEVYVPGLLPGKFMKIRAGATVYSIKRGQYKTVRAMTVRLAYYRRGEYVTAHMALNDREIYKVLEARGFDFEPLKQLRETDYLAFNTDMRVEIHKPRVVWSGSSGYWNATDIDNVSPA